MVLQKPRRTPRTWLRAQFTASPRFIDGWNDLTDCMQPPAGSLDSFVRLHTEVRGEDLSWLWAAFLQWVRVHGRLDENWYRERHQPVAPPSSRLCQPSLAVDELWLVLAGNADAWRELPEHVQVMQRVPLRDPHGRINLQDTYERAFIDEYGSRLPLLFRIDEILGIHGARLYRAECVVEDCPEKSDAGLDPEPGRTCLHKIPWVATASPLWGCS